MSNKKWVAAFNHWMDDYTKDPDSYKDISTEALEFLREKLDGREPTYGEEAAAIFAGYLEKA